MPRAPHSSNITHAHVYTDAGRPIGQRNPPTQMMTMLVLRMADGACEQARIATVTMIAMACVHLLRIAAGKITREIQYYKKFCCWPQWLDMMRLC
eukprot:8642697-Pyramimonas_sp.AAC.1